MLRPRNQNELPGLRETFSHVRLQAGDSNIGFDGVRPPPLIVRDRPPRQRFDFRMTDGESRLNQSPFRVSASYRMSFDRNFQPKPAVAAVIQTAPHPRNCRDLQLPIQLSAR